MEGRSAAINRCRSRSITSINDWPKQTCASGQRCGVVHISCCSSHPEPSMPLDHPFYEVANLATKHILAGHSIHQKFTCRRCGSRQTVAEPNKIFEKGECEECGCVTDLVVNG